MSNMCWFFLVSHAMRGRNPQCFFSKTEKIRAVSIHVKSYKYKILVKFYFKFGWSWGTFGRSDVLPCAEPA